LRGCLLRPRQRASRTELTLPASFPFSSFSSHLRTICWSPQGSAAWWHWLDSHFRQLRLQQLLPFLLLLLLLLLLPGVPPERRENGPLTPHFCLKCRCHHHHHHLRWSGEHRHRCSCRCQGESPEGCCCEAVTPDDVHQRPPPCERQLPSTTTTTTLLLLLLILVLVLTLQPPPDVAARMRCRAGERGETKGAAAQPQKEVRSLPRHWSADRDCYQHQRHQQQQQQQRQLARGFYFSSPSRATTIRQTRTIETTTTRTSETTNLVRENGRALFRSSFSVVQDDRHHRHPPRHPRPCRLHHQRHQQE